MVMKIWNDLMLRMGVITYEIAHAYMVPWHGIYEKAHACNAYMHSTSQMAWMTWYDIKFIACMACKMLGLFVTCLCGS